MRLPILFATLGLAWVNPAGAAIYKCTVAGETVFSERPCGASAERVDPERHAEEVRAKRAQEETARRERERVEQERRRQEWLEAKAERERKAEEERVETIRGLAIPEHLKQWMLNREVGPGMTPSMVRLAWGEPTRVNRSIYATGTTEQWVYERGRRRPQYVHFTNDIVTSVME